MFICIKVLYHIINYNILLATVDIASLSTFGMREINQNIGTFFDNQMQLKDCMKTSLAGLNLKVQSTVLQEEILKPAMGAVWCLRIYIYLHNRVISHYQ